MKTESFDRAKKIADQWPSWKKSYQLTTSQSCISKPSDNSRIKNKSKSELSTQIEQN